MEQFTLELNKNFQRPIVYLNSWHGINALLDTGALFPVWTASEDVLKSLGGICIRKNIKFGGFGGETEGSLYRLSGVTIGKLIFPELMVVSSRNLKSVPYHVILSATMFRELIYEIDDKNHRLNITIPNGESTIRNLTIEDSNGRLYVLCQSVSYDLIE